MLLTWNLLTSVGIVPRKREKPRIFDTIIFACACVHSHCQHFTRISCVELFCWLQSKLFLIKHSYDGSVNVWYFFPLVTLVNSCSGTCKLLFCCSVIDCDSCYALARLQYFEHLSMITSYILVHLGTRIVIHSAVSVDSIYVGIGRRFLSIGKRVPWTRRTISSLLSHYYPLSHRLSFIILCVVVLRTEVSRLRLSVGLEIIAFYYTLEYADTRTQ